MLRCAGCGEMVSEWAAYCPRCRHSTDDAQSSEPVAPVPEGAPRPSAGQIRQLNRPAGRGMAVVVAVLLVGGLVGIATQGGRTAGPAGLVGVPIVSGRVVSEADDGTLYISSPVGEHSAVAHARSSSRSGRPLFLAENGSLVGVAGGHLEAYTPVLSGRWSLADGDPLTAGGALIVKMDTKWHGPTAVALAVTPSGTRLATLGSADSAAGDPRQVGAFVSVADRDQPAAPASPTPITGLVDSRVELLDVGQLPLVLATANRLVQATGLPPGVPVNLAVYPGPDGQKVAVTVMAVGAKLSNAGLVVLDRRGHLLGAVPPAHGPAGYSPAYWSSDGRSIAYESFSSVGTSLVVVDDRYQPAEQDLQPTTSIAGCTWSPDSRWLLCLATSAYTDNWVLASNSTTMTPIYSVPARNRPVVWLAG